MAGVISAGAVPIDLGQTIGSPADFNSALGRLNTQINIYNVANNPDLPLAVAAGGIGPINATGLSIQLNVTGWTYLCLKWADTDQFYYVGGDTGLLTFNSTVFNTDNRPQGLSGYDFFNPKSTTVPDGGSSMMMLGAALTGLSLAVRRFKK